MGRPRERQLLLDENLPRGWRKPFRRTTALTPSTLATFTMPPGLNIVPDPLGTFPPEGLAPPG